MQVPGIHTCHVSPAAEAARARAMGESRDVELLGLRMLLSFWADWKAVTCICCVQCALSCAWCRLC